MTRTDFVGMAVVVGIVFCVFAALILYRWAICAIPKMFARINKKRYIGEVALLSDIFKPGERIRVLGSMWDSVSQRLLAIVTSAGSDRPRVVSLQGMIFQDAGDFISSVEISKGEYVYRVQEIIDKATGKRQVTEELVQTPIQGDGFTMSHKRRRVLRRVGCDN